MDKTNAFGPSGAATGDGSTVEHKNATWRDYVTVTKPGIVRSNLLMTFVGIWLALHSSYADPQLSTVDMIGISLAILFGTMLVLAGGCVLNNYIDREWDLQMSRTMARPSATGALSAKTLLWYGNSLYIAGAVVLALVEPLAAFIGLVGVFFYVIVYTKWLKRTSTLNTIIGGISGAIPPMIGWSAITGGVEAGAWVLFLFMFLWQPPHFLALAIVRSKEYHEAGYKMLPGENGFALTKRQMLLWTALLVPASLLLNIVGMVGYIYLVTALVLGLTWFFMLLRGFFVADDIAWARKMFGFSLIYLIAMVVVMIVNAI